MKGGWLYQAKNFPHKLGLDLRVKDGKNRTGETALGSVGWDSFLVRSVWFRSVPVFSELVP